MDWLNVAWLTCFQCAWRGHTGPKSADGHERRFMTKHWMRVEGMRQEWLIATDKCLFPNVVENLLSGHRMTKNGPVTRHHQSRVALGGKMTVPGWGLVGACRLSSALPSPSWDDHFKLLEEAGSPPSANIYKECWKLGACAQ